MKNKFFLYFFVILMSFSYLQALKNDSLYSSSRQYEPKIVIHPRIFVKVNGKPISTYDLMKKLDLTFYRQYPEYSSSVEARFQFYEMSWRPALEEIIDKELILADAQESKIEVTNGDVMQEMEVLFGPNIIERLDEAGFTFDEAAKMIQEELIIRRLIAGRVHSKAIGHATPSKIRLAYQEFIQNPDNLRLNEWSYRIITVKERDLKKTEEVALAAYQFLLDGTPLDQVITRLKEQKLITRRGKVTISNTIHQNDKELSKEYKEVLIGLEKGMYSQPFSHKSRSNNTTVSRILIVEEKIPGGIPSYQEMESRIKEQLLDKAIDRETDSYLMRLRQHYHIQPTDIEANLPPGYQPFSLQ